MERAGTRSTEVVVQHPAPAAAGALGEVWMTLDAFWVSVEIRQPERATRNGVSFDQEVARFRFEWLDGESLTRSMRVVFEGRFYEISNIDRSSDTRRTVVVDAMVSLADGRLQQEGIERRIREGVIVTVRREDFNQDPVDVPARALVEGYKPDELVGGINQGDRKIMILAADILPSALGKVKDGDVIILPDGEHLTALNVDAYTHRFGSNLVAYEMTGTGG